MVNTKMTSSLSPVLLAKNMLCVLFLFGTAFQTIQANKIDSQDCFVCDYMQGLIQLLPAANKTQENAKNGLRDFCHLAYPSSEQSCLKRSVGYLPFIIDAIKDGHGADEQVCDVVTGQKCHPATLSANSRQSGVVCAACFLGTAVLNQALLKYEPTVEEMVKSICDWKYLKDADKPACKRVIQENFATIYAGIIMTVTGKGICGSIIGCPISASADQMQTIVPNSVITDVECYACDMAFKYLQKFLSKKHVEQIVEKIMHKACNLIPVDDIRKDCTDLVDTYEGKIVKALLDYLQGRIICKKFTVCKEDS